MANGPQKIGCACAPWLVVSGAILWGTTGTAQAFAPAEATSVAVGALRIACGGIALLAVALLRGAFHVKGGRWPPLLTFLTAACMAAYQPFFFTGVARSGVAVGTVVTLGSAPIFAGFLSFLVERKPLEPRWIAATVLAVAGCVLLFADPAALVMDPVGVAFSLLAGLAYAGYVVTGKELLKTHGADAVMAVAFCLAAVLLLPLLLMQPLDWVFTARGLLVVLHLGLVATALSYFLFARGLALIPAATAVTLTLAEPLTAAMLGVVVLGERLTPLLIAGMVLLLSGILLLSSPQK